jgi:outer membrane protein OmpA-like peptidoglycan-associated protein
MNRFAAAAAFAALMLASPALADDLEMQGAIVSHNGDTLVVSTGGGNSTVKLTPDTKIQAVSGVFGGQKEDHPPSDLIKGLTIDIDYVQNGGENDATKITFKPNDLKTARAINAGVEEGKQKIISAQAENERKQADTERRLSLVGQFSEKGKMNVLFDTGKTEISDKGKMDLQEFAKLAEGIPGYLMRVVGHTDSTGSAKANQRLSNQRASAVTAYLVNTCKVPAEKMISPAGMGDTAPVDQASGKNSAANRRVTVFVLVSKASEKSAPSASAQ